MADAVIEANQGATAEEEIFEDVTEGSDDIEEIVAAESEEA